MEASKLKNMVVIRNLPSNIVDEAIIVLKTSKKIKKLQKVENNRKDIFNNDLKEKYRKIKKYSIAITIVCIIQIILIVFK